MQEFEFVPKREYQPIKNEIETIIRRVHTIMKDKYGVDFEYQLIGSGKRHLITRVKDGNKGYDFDYNLILPALGDRQKYKPAVIANQFMDAFAQTIKGTSYKFPKHRTSVIRLRNVNQKEKKVSYGCDFAIIYYGEDEDDGYKYLKHWDDGHYTFEMRSQSQNIAWKLDEILEYENGWNWIREEYLKLKCRNRDINKHSYVLYLESVHNVYNQIQQWDDEG